MFYPELDPVLVEIGPLKVHWYGVMYLIGFAGGWLLGRWRAGRIGSLLQKPQIDDLLFYVAMGAVVGGRVGYILFYGYDSWLDDPLRLLRVWEGGMSFHGGFLGVLVAMLLFGRKHDRKFFELTDFIAPLVPIGLAAGRFGNFINGELWGRPTDVPWAMQVSCEQFVALCRSKLHLSAGAEFSPPLHPTQLYEALLEGVLLFAILWIFSAKKRPRMAVSALFLIGYGGFRFMVEFVRMPDAHIGYLAAEWFTMGQLLTLPMVIIGAVMLYFAYRKQS